MSRQGKPRNKAGRAFDGGRALYDYRINSPVDTESLVDVYRDSTLGPRRPLDDAAVVEAMFRNADLTVTAWDGDRLVGVARTLTDFGYVGYLADLVVRESHQRRGIGLELIRRTRREMGPRSTLVLLAAPQAVDYYPHVGFTRHDSAWVLKAGDPL